jgi:hypothetical protein
MNPESERLESERPDSGLYGRPTAAELVAAVAEFLEGEGAAIEILQYLRSQGGSTELLRRLAKLLERRGDFQEAALVYRELLSQPDAQTSPQQA